MNEYEEMKHMFGNGNAATQLYEVFQMFVVAGFTEDQAIKIICSMLSDAVNRK